jgi:hypothetical protein
MMAISTNSSIDREDDRYKRQLLLTDLKRLVERMETYNPDSLSSYTLRGRASMAMDLLQQLSLADETLRNRVLEACRKAEELAMKRSEKEIDWVDEIFFKPAHQKLHHNQSKVTERDDDEEIDGVIPIESNLDIQRETSDNHQLYPLTQSTDIKVHDNIEDLQNAQREQLEEEIMHMTEQLKASTQRMNSTIRGHSDHLEAMETLATENLHQIGKATDRIDDYNKKSWQSTLATWTLMIIVFSSFLFCMLIIRTIPKRKNTSIPCFMNCNSNDKSLQQRALIKLEELRQTQMEIEYEAEQLHENILTKDEEIIQDKDAHDTLRVVEEDAAISTPKASSVCNAENKNNDCIVPQEHDTEIGVALITEDGVVVTE